MKNTFKITLFLLAFYFSNAQTTVKLKEFYNSSSIYKNNEIYSEIYYKDIDNLFSPFIGSWRYQNGINTFIITIWKDTKVGYPSESPIEYTDNLCAHYRMIQNYGTTNEIEIYTSQKMIGNSTTTWHSIINAASTVPNRMSGVIYDVAGITNPNYPLGTRGMLLMTINTSTSPITAKWEVELPDGIYGLDQPTTFIIPTNVTLTKI